MGWISVAVLYLSSRLVVWMRYLYMLDGFPEDYRAVTIKNIVTYYFPFVDLCVLVYVKYDAFSENDMDNRKLMTYIILCFYVRYCNWYCVFLIPPNNSFFTFWIRGLLRISSNKRAFS